MDETFVIKLISQYLHERGYQETLKSLQTERYESLLTISIN